MPPVPRTVVNAVRHEIRTGEDAEDRLRWVRLLARCRREDRALAKALGFLRRRGAALEPHGAGCRLVSGTMDPAAYAAARQRDLAPRGRALAAVLERLGGD